jgi:hypothetical protein
MEVTLIYAQSFEENKEYVLNVLQNSKKCKTENGIVYFKLNEIET